MISSIGVTFVEGQKLCIVIEPTMTTEFLGIRIQDDFIFPGNINTNFIVRETFARVKIEYEN